MINNNQKKWNKLNLFLNSYFNIFLTILLVFILIIAFLLVLRPQYKKTLNIIQQNLEEQQRLYAGQQKKLVNLQAITAVYKQISPADLQKFDVILPNDYPTEALFGELEELITQSGFILSSVNFTRDEVASDSAVGHVNMNLALGAVDYAGLKSLLRKLENNMRLLDIQNLNFSPSEETLSLSMTTYYYKQ